MERKKRTYSIPADTLRRFESEVLPRRRSGQIAELILEWLAEKERETVRREIEEGCREMWSVYREEAEAWRPLDAEVDRAIDR